MLYRNLYWAHPAENKKKQNNELNKLKTILVKLIGCSDPAGYDELCTNMSDKKCVHLETHEWVLVHIRR
jgi:hypothetical protein